MHVAARVGIAAASASAVGYGVYQLDKLAANRTRDDHAQIDREVAEQSAAWDTWTAALDREFPGQRLETPADHARFEQFLEANPKPTWLSVQHEDFTKVRLGLSSRVIDDDLFPVEREKAIGYSAMGALGTTGMGGGLLVSSLRSSSTSFAAAGKIAGGAALVALGVGLLGTVVGDVRRGTNLDGYNELMGRVRTRMA